MISGLVHSLWVVKKRYFFTSFVVIHILGEILVWGLPFFIFFLCRREAVKGNKNRTKKPTEVPVPGKVQIH